ncbi:MAG TPA: SDR family NAD(P)-dependent oxidoreductase [Bryobacteraceae bacterium]|nr:SDR family NAD(P)-dependent oxidoreductase [Bryobacteraceae bacterium]
MGAAAVLIGCTNLTEAMCRLLLEQGATYVGIISGDIEGLCAPRERLADSRVISLHANLGRREQVEAALKVFRAKAGRVDMIVNSAAPLCCMGAGRPPRYKQ